MNQFAPAGTLPAHILPASASESADQIRPTLTTGETPGAVVILIDVTVQGVED